MDSFIDSALEVGPLQPRFYWNSYTGSVPRPRFFPGYQSPTPYPKGDSFLSQELQASLTDVFYQLIDMHADPNVVQGAVSSLDPVRGAVKTSNFKYTREYYELKDLDCSLNVISKAQPVMLFTPRAREYLVEMECPITMSFILSNLKENGSRLQMELVGYGDEIPDDAFYLNVIGNEIPDAFHNYAFDKRTVAGRWRTFDEEYTLPTMSLIVLEEDTYGRRGYHLEKDGTYDMVFTETLFRSLGALLQGGNVVVKLLSLGSRVIADVIYIYKYLFNEVTLVKPMTSNPISMEHYLVAKGFRADLYFQIKGDLQALLEALSEQFLEIQAQEYNLLVFSLIANLDESPNFTDWLTSVNNDIASAIYAESLSLGRALEDRNDGFQEAHPIYYLDQNQIRESLGELGRTTLKALPKFNTTFPVPEVDSIIAGNEQNTMTQTGQTTENEIVLTPGSSELGLGFLVYFALNTMLIKDIMSLPILRSLIPPLGSTDGQTRITSHVYDSKLRIQSYLIREWLGNLFSLGDLYQFLGSEKAFVPMSAQEISALLKSRSWTLRDLVGTSLTEFAVRNLNLEQFYLDLGLIFSRFAQSVISARTNYIFKDLILRITPLDSLRFRLTYSFNGIKYVMAEQSNSGVLGEYEMIKLLRPEEASQLDTFQGVISLFKNKQFLTRVFNHSALPIYFSGYQNELAVPDLYFTYRPELEFFASAVNRHAPYWCSANPDDDLLGSQGNFFGSISTPDHPFYKEGKVQTAIAFPPNNPQLLSMVLKRCVELFFKLNQKLTTYLKGGSQGEPAYPIAIILIYEDSKVNSELVEDYLVSVSSMGNSIPFKSIDKLYDPFSGTFIYNRRHKALYLKTIGHPLVV